MNVTHHITTPAGSDLRVTVSRRVPRGYAWVFGFMTAAFFAIAIAAIVEEASAPQPMTAGEAAYGLAVAAVFVGVPLFGTVIHAKPLVEEVTVRYGTLRLVRRRYRSRVVFTGSLEEGLQIGVRDTFWAEIDGEPPAELLFSVRGRAASFGDVLPLQTLLTLRAQLDAALRGVAWSADEGRLHSGRRPRAIDVA